MIEKIDYIAKCGLPITILKNKDFSSVYAGIGVKFGGSNLRYSIDNIAYSVRPGTAHFLEHKKYSMQDGHDAMVTFSKYGEGNAYTSSDKTIYYFDNVKDYKESLKELLEMYFTRHFDVKEIAKEKSIIINEYRDRYDEVYTRISRDLIKRLYPKDDYSKSILGNINDIKNMTVRDLEKAYDVFYTPQNSYLVISGNVEDDIIDFIEDILSKLSFNKNVACKLSYIQSTDVLKPMTKYYEVNNESVIIAFRIDELNNSESIQLDKIGAVLDSLFMENSDFFKELYDDGLVEDSIDYYIDCHSFSTYIEIEAISNNSKKLADKIIAKILNLTSADVNQKQINQYIKYKKRSCLEKEDSVKSIGSSYLSSALEDDDYFNVINDVMNLTYENVIEIFGPLSRAKATYLIAKPKK